MTPDPGRAADQAAAAALATCPDPTLALAFATGGFGTRLPELLDGLHAALGTREVVGATAHGVVAAGQEAEGGSALAVLALAGVEAEPFLVPDLSSAHAPEEVVAHAGGGRVEDLVVLLPDPAALRAEPLLEALRRELGAATVVGAGAVEDASGRAHQWYRGEVHSGALAGLRLRGASPPQVGVTQACRPVTEVQRITRTEGNWILEIDGRPALDVYRKSVVGSLQSDLRRAALFVLAAFPRSEQDPLAPGRYLVRHLVGFAERERALAVPERVEAGDAIAFVQREPETARADLKEMLAPMPRDRGTCAIWLDCCARGAGFFGVEGLEAAYLEQALGATPVVGMLGSCEIGPVAGRSELLTYTGVLAHLDA